MKKGIVFSIEEFAVYDGPGPRVNVFLKGCPLRCQWCHNPEGWDVKPQIVKSKNGCIECGTCQAVCGHPDACILCEECITQCPRGLIRVSGTTYTSEELAKKLMWYQPLLNSCGGGVTFSGGEVLMQSDFLCDVIDQLENLSVCIETCGYGSSDDFCRLIQKVDHVFYDIKLMDPAKHRKYTQKDNVLILKNAALLMECGTPFTIRIPLVQGVNCDVENIMAVTEFFADARNLAEIELLPYNRFAGAKYALLGKTYAHDDFEPPSQETLDRIKAIVEEAGIRCSIRKSLSL